MIVLPILKTARS